MGNVSSWFRIGVDRNGVISSPCSLQDESGQQRSLSVLATESPGWQGSLPFGPSSDNYTMLIIGTYALEGANR